jgi:hypothetical protein
MLLGNGKLGNFWKCEEREFPGFLITKQRRVICCALLVHSEHVGVIFHIDLTSCCSPLTSNLAEY